MDDLMQQLIALAANEAAMVHAEAIEPVHLFIAICKQPDPAVTSTTKAFNIDLTHLRRQIRAHSTRIPRKTAPTPQRISSRVQNIVNQAYTRATSLGLPCSQVHLFIELLLTPDIGLKYAMDCERLPTIDLVQGLVQQAQQYTTERGGKDDPALAREGRLSPVKGQQGQESITASTGKDYTALAREGRLSPVIGRDEEIKQVIRVLLRKQKSNPLLLGDAGVGKTSIIEGLAQHVVAPQAPPEIRDWRIVEILPSSLVAGTTYRGQFEEKLQGLIREWEADPHLVVFLDEIHTLIGAGGGGGSMDAANILKPALARGTIRCIGATTTDEYRRYVEKDPALERRFLPVRVEEPTPEQTREILRGVRAGYERHHQVQITDDAVNAAVELSVKYIPDRRLPDKARDLLDQAASNKRFLSFHPALPSERSNQVTREDIARVVSEVTGIPTERMTADKRARLLQMEDALRRRVIGQDVAVTAVAQAVRTALIGLANPRRPAGVFLFTGPSGTGKTELVKALAEFLFDDERRLLRFDMSEYMEQHSISKLVGSPPGYIGHEEGARLTDAVRKNPYCVVLFDEIEKAHPNISDIFLQMFDDGRLTDSKGKTADFRNTIIIMTSNLGADAPPDHVRQVLLTHFRPELINRIGHIIHFNQLRQSDFRRIADKVINQVRERLAALQIEIRVSPAACDALIEEGFKTEYGARGIERMVEQKIVQPVSEGILGGKIANGSHISIDTGPKGIRWVIVAA